ncbi:helix-turn-helix domain-containing protein [Solirubrobacter taibaiensis]|nr:helix-turn-helix domain-containing protein [Solirubrobacter taibaiensis]
MSFDAPRELNDPKAMRALAHPVRIALLEALTVHAQLTATEAGEIVGESPANTSFHLRQLAKYGFVEEAEGGTGRRRPWRRKELGLRFTEVHADDETAAAARELSRLYSHRFIERAERGLEDNRALPEVWRAALGWNQVALHLTPDEVKEIDEALLAVFAPYGDRREPTEDQPHGAKRVEFLTFAYRL